MAMALHKLDLFVSVIAVLHDNALVLRQFVEELSSILDRHYMNYEVLLIDNGSTDRTEEAVRQLLKQYKCLRYLRFTRQSDEETAIMAGLDGAIGDFVVSLNADCDPPSDLVEMVEQCRDGHDVVLGVARNAEPPGLVYSTFRRVFLAAARKLVGVDITTGTTRFRAYSRHAVNVLVKIRLRRRYFAVIAADVGFKTAFHPYDLISRSGQRRTRRLFRGVRIGLSVLIHNSIALLRVASTLGFIGSGLSFCYSLYVVIVYLFKVDVMPGWTTLSLAMSGLFAIAFVILALIGEYLGRLLEETSDRPLYYLRDEQSSQVMLADSTTRNVLDRSEATAAGLPGERSL